MNSEAIPRLQRWYLAQCNGEWEHNRGVSITTLDNPGWSIDINLSGTDLESKVFETVERLEHQDEWIVCQRTPTQFQGRGGPLMLDRIIAIFLEWADESSGP
ncbi:MAG: immunity 53 family protein [Chthoniobacter sp.]|uniref:immunity 53 family protein n=1 Tax=Chthoniobacter sp. TaxID=2510640 RepID=UPI0032A60C09